jgi:GntR family transcriptional regulator
MQINPKAPKPIFKQISDAIRRDIASEVLKHDDAVPSERYYAETLGVSRMTVRAAINELVQEGLLVRSPGRATMVARVANGKINKNAVRFMSFSEDMKARGMKASSRLLSCKEEVADAAVAAQLGLTTGARVIVIERVRLANNEPMALESAYLPHQRFAGLTQFDLNQHSLYDLMEQKFGARPKLADETIEAVALSNAEAKLLGVRPASPALLARRVTRDTEGKVIEVAKAIYRGDRYRMVFVRER